MQGHEHFSNFFSSLSKHNEGNNHEKKLAVDNVFPGLLVDSDSRSSELGG